ncbi:MAG: hypothetical protein A2Y95_06250 [Deltaproteobacteria bacterium RBG_13_65_10]|nr:MAG: hypothetical protein A2Y95_06250 [Deltaproteobacteria bacterium RBG_13_65_10]
MGSGNKIRGTGRSKAKTPVLDRLNPDETVEVLRRLLAAHPDLVGEAERTATAVLGAVTFEDVANDVEDAVRAPDLDDLHGRAGRHEWGYVEPTEAVWEILDEAVQAFVDDIKRRIELGLETEALEICKGVLLGLYRVEHGKSEGLLEYASDFPAEAAGGAIEAWRTGDRGKKPARAGARRKRPVFPQEFIDRFVPEWRDMIGRVLSRKR